MTASTASRVLSLLSSLASTHLPSSRPVPPDRISDCFLSEASTTSSHRFRRLSFSFFSIVGFIARYSAKALASLTVRSLRPPRFRLDPGTPRRRERKSSSDAERNVDKGVSERSGSCLLDRVVIISLISPSGNFSSRVWRSCVIVVVGGTGKTTVDGRPRPGKVETRTLRCFGAILIGMSASRVCSIERAEVTRSGRVKFGWALGRLFS
ncbi:hypothetical protein L249_2412 [Ophiocordyceps polyrhachis-furcata BCC 54312]|uniref:Uncharacterized protein n=1 Tax=Ophiocordyceps polyrhachis-furcata BCC 54312 TaxID=1330021 RepID=A0A367LPZ3_9HYPO|nr:hypothetical protein L249_2412 [Ophiocordyceps polyrhachis-furcata BCC 54312]